MTPEKEIQNMIKTGELININDKVTMQIFDAKIGEDDTAVWQLIGYSSELDVYMTMNYYANMSTA